MNRSVGILSIALVTGCVASSIDPDEVDGADGSQSTVAHADCSLTNAAGDAHPSVTDLAREIAVARETFAREVVDLRRELQTRYLRVSLRRITLDRSAAETCHQHGETCLAVESAQTYDRRGRFWGHAVFSCSSRVRRKQGCMPATAGRPRHDYFLTGPSSFHRPLDARVPGMPSEGLCLSEPSYFAAVCAASSSAPPTL